MNPYVYFSTINQKVITVCLYTSATGTGTKVIPTRRYFLVSTFPFISTAVALGTLMRASPFPVVFSLHLRWITFLIHWLLNTWLQKKSSLKRTASLSSELRSLKGDLDRPKEENLNMQRATLPGPPSSCSGKVFVLPVQLKIHDSLLQGLF